MVVSNYSVFFLPTLVCGPSSIISHFFNVYLKSTFTIDRLLFLTYAVKQVLYNQTKEIQLTGLVFPSANTGP